MPKKGVKKERISRKPLDFILLVTVLLLLSLGIIMLLSASAPSALSNYGDSYCFVKKQGIFAIAGLALMFFFSKIDYRKYKRFYKLAYILSNILLAAVILPGIGSGAKGATRWLNIGIRFQPSELAKIGLIIFYAGYFSEHKNKMGTFKEGFVKPILYLIPPVLILFFFQDHLSAAIIIVMVTSIMMLMAGCRLRYFLTVGVSLGTVGAAGMYYLAKKTEKGSFRIARITSFIDPWKDATGSGYHAIQGLYAIGSGGLFGVGLGNSKQKYQYIPEPQNDFIFAVLAEELGFVGCLIVIALFGIFIWRGFIISMKAPDSFGSLIAVGITSLIGVQVIMNIAVVTSSMPVTGVSLPFFSYGGTSLVILLCCVGILLNISRAGARV